MFLVKWPEFSMRNTKAALANQSPSPSHCEVRTPHRLYCSKQHLMRPASPDLLPLKNAAAMLAIPR